jgi:hypothetical protein
VLGAEVAYFVCLLGGFLPIRTAVGIDIHHRIFETLPGFVWLNIQSVILGAVYVVSEPFPLSICDEKCGKIGLFLQCFSGPENQKWLKYGAKSIFPSWTSRVRPPSPALSFGNLTTRLPCSFR